MPEVELFGCAFYGIPRFRLGWSRGVSTLTLLSDHKISEASWVVARLAPHSFDS